MLLKSPATQPQPTTTYRVLNAITQSPSDFRTVCSLAEQLDVSPRVIRQALVELGDVVRQPVDPHPAYDDWWRLTSRGLTKQEKRLRFLCLITFRPMRDNW